MRALRHDVSERLSVAIDPGVREIAGQSVDRPANSLSPGDEDDVASPTDTVIPAPVITVPRGSAAIEQLSEGRRPAPVIAANFTGFGADFVGPQGNAALRNPSDNSLDPIVADQLLLESGDGDIVSNPYHSDMLSEKLLIDRLCTVDEHVIEVIKWPEQRESLPDQSARV